MNSSPVPGMPIDDGDRRRLIGLAYRIVGSYADAEDVVQDAWLRWERLGDDGRRAIERPVAWFTTVVSRLALDRLRSAQHQREMYVGPWLPEPVVSAVGSGDPGEAVELAESLTLAFLTVLERLDPVERAVFVLVDLFGEPYSRVAPVVERSEEACRQIAHRARERVHREHRRRAPASRPDELVAAFFGACAMGDLDHLRRLLVDDVVLISDGGAFVHAARRPVVGAERVARFIANLTKRVPPGTDLVPVVVNGDPGLVTFRGVDPWYVIAVEIEADLIAAVRIIINPDKVGGLRHLALSPGT